MVAGDAAKPLAALTATRNIGREFTQGLSDRRRLRARGPTTGLGTGMAIADHHGVLGGLTTFSTFRWGCDLDSTKDGCLTQALLMITHVGGSVCMTLLGIASANVLPGPARFSGSFLGRRRA